MNAKITYTLDTQNEIIDLTDYGHDPNTAWSDLSEVEQNEIRDGLTDCATLSCFGQNH